jgi:hypothetical protein
MIASLQGTRIVLTQASEFMGPALHEVLREHGADVIASDDACGSRVQR